ncbi:hypothetical protein TNIN_261941 [Trichonephila inaurata madagascariensis]|uniref:Uncharacterized protein n=1 Tax=Trichonephila inaurata madagascariensis TaxID=2747483 RepID=A0A8X6WVK2_9ARAC|nr:hypothetical protein TNIN_261941 [Trichonephila inaurata madagascariensis]
MWENSKRHSLEGAGKAGTSKLTREKGVISEIRRGGHRSCAEKREHPEWRPSRDPPPVVHTRDEQVTLFNQIPKTIGKVKYGSAMLKRKGSVTNDAARRWQAIRERERRAAETEEGINRRMSAMTQRFQERNDKEVTDWQP